MNERTFDDLIAESFRKDPSYAISLLNEILENGQEEELFIMLRQMRKAFGKDHPLPLPEGEKISTLLSTIRTMGLRLSVHPSEANRPAHISP